MKEALLPESWYVIDTLQFSIQILHLPKKFFKKELPKIIKEEAKDLRNKNNFQLKLIDFGFAKTFNEVDEELDDE